MAALPLFQTPLINKTSLRGYWKEGQLNDQTPNGYNLTAINGPQLVSGLFANAYNFVYTSQQALRVTNAQAPGLEITSDFTWMIWVKYIKPAVGVDTAFLSKSNANATILRRISISHPLNSPPNGFISFGLNDGNVGVSSSFSANDINGIWVPIAVRWNDTTKIADIFINGLKSSAQLPMNTVITPSDGDFAIGRDGSGGSNANGLTGEVSVFAEALTDSEILNYQAGTFGSSSPSLSSSASPSASTSPSSSTSPSTSVSASPSLSASPSSSFSQSPSSSASPSASQSPSSSVSPSPSKEDSNFSRGAYTTLPTGEDNLDNAYTNNEEAKIIRLNQITVGQDALLQFMVHQFKRYIGKNTACEVRCIVNSTMAPNLSQVVLEIYNYLTHSWEVLDTNYTAHQDTDFEMSGELKNVTRYKNPFDSVTCRVYQLAR